MSIGNDTRLGAIFMLAVAAVLILRGGRHTLLASNEYSWVLEGDIKACFDEIDHRALLDRVRTRVGDKRVVSLVKAGIGLI